MHIPNPQPHHVQDTTMQTLTPTQGGTYDHEGRPVSPSHGYAVGIRSFPSLRAAIRAARPGQYVGWWRDGDSGILYYDLVLIVYDEEEAIRMGEKRGEKAIYSFADSREIRLDRSIQAA